MKHYHTLALRELFAQKMTSFLILTAIVLSTMMTAAVGQSAGVLAAGQLVRQVVQPVPEPQQFRQLIQIPFVRLLFVQKQRHQDVFPGRQHRQEVELLENKAHLPASEGGQFFV